MHDMPMPRCRCGLRSRIAATPEAWPTCCGWAGIASCTPRASPRTSTGRYSAARHQLVTMRSDLDAQIRGILKTFGLILGTGNKDTLIQRAEKLAAGHPVLSGLVAKLAEVRRHVTSQIAAIDRDIRHLVHTEPTLKRLISVPGVGPITALAFLSAVDDPSRFKHARDVGPYLGLTPTRYQSGETDRQGRISKRGDTFTRPCLYEAAHGRLTR